MDLNNKVALIMGASNEFGKAIALEFDRGGMKLILIGDSEDELKETASNCKQAKVFAGSFTEKETAQRLLDFALDSFGQLDILVGDAGITVAVGSMDIDRICSFAKREDEDTMKYSIEYDKSRGISPETHALYRRLSLQHD